MREAAGWAVEELSSPGRVIDVVFHEQLGGMLKFYHHLSGIAAFRTRPAFVATHSVNTAAMIYATLPKALAGSDEASVVETAFPKNNRSFLFSHQTGYS